jgi:hypothetical protein
LRFFNFFFLHQKNFFSAPHKFDFDIDINSIRKTIYKPAKKIHRINMSAYAIACIEHQLLRKPGFYQRPEPREIIDLADNDVMTLIGKAVVKAREEHTLAYWVDRTMKVLDEEAPRGSEGAKLYLKYRDTHNLIEGTQAYLAKRWAQGPRPGDHRRHGRRPEDYSIKPKQLRTKYYKKFVIDFGYLPNPRLWR